MGEVGILDDRPGGHDHLGARERVLPARGGLRQVAEPLDPLRVGIPGADRDVRG